MIEGMHSLKKDVKVQAQGYNRVEDKHEAFNI